MCAFEVLALHCSFPNCHHFSEQRKCVALNRNSRSSTGTHLSEQRRCSSAHGRRAAHVPKLPLLVSKLRSVTVGEDHMITSSASNCCRTSLLARTVGPYANSRACLASPGGAYFCRFFVSDPTFSMSWRSYRGLALEIQSVSF